MGVGTCIDFYGTCDGITKGVQQQKGGGCRTTFLGIALTGNIRNILGIFDTL